MALAETVEASTTALQIASASIDSDYHSTVGGLVCLSTIHTWGPSSKVHGLDSKEEVVGGIHLSWFDLPT